MQKEVHLNASNQKSPRSPVADRALPEKLLRYLLFAALGALLAGAELFFGVKPFSLALAAAATEMLPAVALGAAAFYLVGADYLSLAALVLAVGVRVAIALFLQKDRLSQELLQDRPLYRVFAAALAAFAVGITVLLRGNFLYYDLFRLLLSVAVAPAATLLYLGVFSEKDSPIPSAKGTGTAALTLTAVYALRELSLFGIYPAAVLAAGIAFLLTAHRGIPWGAAGGLLAGLCFEVRFAPAFLLAALAFGLLQKSSRGGAVLAGGAAAAGYAFLIGKTAALVALLPALLTAGALFLATDSAGLVEGAPARLQAAARRRAAAQSAKAGAATAGEAHFKELAEALTELSGVFYELGARTRRPGVAELHRLCDKTLDTACLACPQRPTCWGVEYQITAQTVSKMAHSLHASGTVDRSLIPAEMAARCDKLTGILSAVNQGAAILTEEAARGDRTAVVALDYAVMSRMLTEGVEEAQEAYRLDPQLGERIAERLIRHGYTLESVAVCGEEHRRVILRGIRLPGRHLKIRELRQRIEQVCRFALGEPQITESDGGTDVIFGQRVRLKSTTVKLSRPKDRESKYCGDSVQSLASPHDRDYSFICDGMGSGNTAAYTSTLAATFLSRFLTAGSRPDSVLRMLNGFLAVGRRREGEASTTVDLLELDRITGRVSLFKCGAAPTYLLRRGEVSCHLSRTAPVGILETLDAERISFQAEAGDVIVQISDGFTAGEEECLFLAEMLRTAWDGDAESFARLCLNRAAAKADDDLSIAVTLVQGITEEGAN